MSLSRFDVNATALEAVWTIDTPAGPLPLSGGQVGLDRSWTPALQATVDYDTEHPLAGEVVPLTRDPLMLRLRTQTAGLPILDTLAPENMIVNSSFEQQVAPWTTTGSASTTISRSTDWAAEGNYSLKAVCTSGNTGVGDFRIGNATTMPLGMEPGKTYTLSATLYMETPYNTPQDTSTTRQRRIIAGASRDGSRYTLIHGETAPNVAGEHRVSVTLDIPEDATGVVILFGCAGSSQDLERVTYWDALMLAEGTSTDYEPGELGEYEWPEDTSGARVNQVAWWVYPRSTREARSQGRTSVELASGDLLLYEARNGSGEPWIAPPSRIFGGNRQYAMTRTASQLIVHAGLRITVAARDDETSPEREPTWAPADNVWSFIQGLLRDRYEWRFDPKTNALKLLLGAAGATVFESKGKLNALDAYITRGDSTELGTLDFADGLLLTWQWEGNDGSSQSRLETFVADHLDSWRDVTKWAELTINSAPQSYGPWLLRNRVAKVAQGTHTLALEPWSIDDLGIAYWDGTSPYQAISFAVDGGTYTITSPLQED